MSRPSIHATLRKRRLARERRKAIREAFTGFAIAILTLPCAAIVGAALAIAIHN